MSRGQNTIKRSEVSTIPFLVKYSSSLASNSFSDRGITVNRGINTDYGTDGIKFLNYAMVKQMYYQEYITGSLLNSSSYWNPNIQSTAASGTLDDDYRYYPTGLGDKITVVAIPRTVFGEQIARKSISFKSNNFNLIDDGNGNIVDAMASYTHVGNILYSQGIAVITNQDYNYALIKADCDISGTALRSEPDNPFIGDGCITGSIYLLTPSNPPTNNLLSRAALSALTPVIADFNTGNFAIPNTPYSVGFPGYPNLTSWFQIKYDGHINIPDTGTFNFKACSDDGAILRLYDLSNTLVYTLNNGGQHSYICANSNVTLTSGVYRFELDYYQGPPIYLGISLYWTRPGGVEEIIPEEYFICYTPGGTTTTSTTTTTTTSVSGPTTTTTTVTPGLTTTTTTAAPGSTTTSTTSTTTTIVPTTTTTTTSTTTAAPTTTSTTTSTTTAYDCTSYDYTYTTVPNDLYVRYSDCTTNTILTVLVDTLPTMDNGNGTFTATICVRNGSSYSVPVCVQNLIEIVCPNGNTWVAGENC
jgi:hypothetical protein